MKREKKNIVLTGFMGTGKTTVGKLLAVELDYEFIDTDELIEARCGRSIPDIFREAGEESFRRMEADIARELADREGLVIATGGRLMLDPANAAALCRKGRVFCLAATPEEIVDRLIKDDEPSRPLLTVPNPALRVAGLLQQRAEAYGRFTQIITNNKSPKEVARELIELIRAE